MTTFGTLQRRYDNARPPEHEHQWQPVNCDGELIGYACMCGKFEEA